MAVVASASAMLDTTIAIQVDFSMETPRNACMMPNTAPTRPMSGAEDAIVARLPSPTLKWAESMLWWRRKVVSAGDGHHLIEPAVAQCVGRITDESAGLLAPIP